MQGTTRSLNHGHPFSRIGRLSGALSFVKPNRNEDGRTCAKKARANGSSPLTPELEGFISRALVPLLVARYIETLKAPAQESDEGAE